MQKLSLTSVIVMFNQQWSLKASPLAIPFHLEQVGLSNKTPVFHENFDQVT